ncbi:hypothetical protein R6L23_05415 [Streptomyces sp. SR27]|uniref:hypothetical protein n=1 Tax=Streptomyces sp. SR27 TaxID=3076630 RepID=UPI00295BA331|nr:hypothetical protein [Streptomyces sp. SR27]MDV9187663.1 hypothetical protein [Streptomyces sp. SR27]
MVVCLAARATGIALSATYAADPVQPLWKPLTGIFVTLARAAAAMALFCWMFSSEVVFARALTLNLEHVYAAWARVVVVGGKAFS